MWQNGVAIVMSVLSFLHDNSGRTRNSSATDRKLRIGVYMARVLGLEVQYNTPSVFPVAWYSRVVQNAEIDIVNMEALS
jgi:hypothetical protein